MKNTQKGSALIVIIIVVVVAILGVLGYVVWNNFITKQSVLTETYNPSMPDAKTFCKEKEGTTAEVGVFCSEDIGIKFEVPAIFVNKIEKAANYEVFQGGVDPNEKQSAGTSENVYSAVISGNDNFTFTVTQEPLRTGDIDFPYKMAPTYFNAVNSKLSEINSPTFHYDSRTERITTEGEYGVGEDVPSFKVNDILMYKGGYGDAGQLADYYLLVVKDKIVKIILKHAAYMGNPANDPSAIDEGKVFDELDKSIKSLTVIR